MKPLEVWTCQRAENLKKKSSKIPKNNYPATMVSAAIKLSAAAAAARRSTKGGGGAHKLSAAAARRGRRTALLQTRRPTRTSEWNNCVRERLDLQLPAARRQEVGGTS